MAKDVMSIAEYKKFAHRAKGLPPRHKPGQMNKTEEKFSQYLAEHLSAELILGWWFEAVTFRIFDDTRYTPDFMVMQCDSTLSLIEVKASFLYSKTGKVRPIAYDDSIVKLKWVAQMFPFRCKMAILQPDKRSWNIKEI